MSTAERAQKAKISAFCRERNLAIPHYLSAPELAAALASALSFLDGGTAQESAEERVKALRKRRATLRRNLDESIKEGAAWERRVKEADSVAYRLKALQLLSRIEHQVGGAIPPPSAPTPSPPPPPPQPQTQAQGCNGMAAAPSSSSAPVDIYAFDDDDTIMAGLPELPFIESTGGLAEAPERVLARR